MKVRGSITVESAIVIPVTLLICGGLIVFGWHFCQKVVAQSQEQLVEDVHMITESPKTLVRITDVLDDLTDSIIFTKDIRESYREGVQKIADRITGF